MASPLSSIPVAPQTDSRGWIGRNIWLLVCAAILLASLVNYAMPKGEREAGVVRVAQETDQLRTDVAKAKAQVEEDRVRIMQAATGHDITREARDAKVGEDLMKIAANWDGVEEYVEARERVIRLWKLPEDSQFLTAFLPGEEQGAYRTDPSGERHFAYSGANSSMLAMTSTLIGVKDDQWTYMGVVQTQTEAANGGTQRTWTAVRYTVDAEGELVSAEAYPSIAEPERSG